MARRANTAHPPYERREPSDLFAGAHERTHVGARPEHALDERRGGGTRRRTAVDDEAHPDAAVVTRELTPQSMPHLDLATLSALMTPEDARSDRQSELVAFSDALIEEVEAADTIVLAVPMYNFSIPSVLKAWLDHIIRAGRTFRYSEAGPWGLEKS